MINVKSVINLNLPKIKQLTDAQITALEQTAEALHTEVVQAQVFPRDTGILQKSIHQVSRLRIPLQKKVTEKYH